MCASCSDGCGGDDIYRAMKECSTVQMLHEEIQLRAQDETEPDQWETQILVRVLSKYRMILVCDESFKATAKEMKLETADTLEEALERARKIMGETAHVVVIPDGVSVIVK